MQIWVDADACPKPIKEILFRAATRTGIAVTLIAKSIRSGRISSETVIREIAMPPATLSSIDQRRLERLAADAGSTPKTMLKHVLRDGFEYCEHVVRAVNQGLDDARSGKTVTGTDVRRKAREVIVRHAAKQAA
jgi:predicted transcriptional regulator